MSNCADIPRLNSVLVQPLPRSADRYQPQLTFSHDERMLVVSVNEPKSVMRDWWRLREIDVAAVALILLVILVSLRVRNVLRTPQTRGRLYCRRCNYDVTDATAPTRMIPRCSECGANVLVQRGLRGRSALRRLWAALLTGSLLCPLLLWRVTVGLGPAAPRTTSWPFAAIGRLIPQWPLQRRVWPEDLQSLVFQVPLDGTSKASAVQTLESAEWTASPNGDKVLRLEEFFTGTKTADLHVVDVRSGIRHRVSLDRGDSFAPSWRGFTSDGREAVVSAYDNGEEHPTQDKDVPPEERVCVVVRAVDLESGETREVGRALTRKVRLKYDTWYVPRYLVGVGEHSRWAVLFLDGKDAGTLVSDHGSGVRYGVYSPAAKLADSLDEGHNLVLDDSRVTVRPTSDWGGIRLDLWPDGTTTRHGIRYPSWKLDNPNVLIDTGTPIAALDGTPAGSVFRFEVSPSGRWLAVVCVSTNDPSRKTPTLKVFDLSDTRQLPAP